MTEIKDVLFAAVDNADYILRVALFAAIVVSPLVVLVALVSYFGQEIDMDEKLDGQVYVISTDEGESIAEDNKGFILVFDTIKQIGDWAVANNIPFEKIIVDRVNVLGVGEDDK